MGYVTKLKKIFKMNSETKNNSEKKNEIDNTQIGVADRA